MYSEFEHNISKDTILKDPMGTFLESFSRIGPGEQVWFQIILEPIEEFRWKNKCIEKIKEIIGEKAPSKKNIFSFLTDNPITKEVGKSFEEFNAQVAGGLRGEDVDSAKKDDGPMNNLLYMTPGQRDLVEKMEQQVSKIGFMTKMRGIYVARNEVYNPSRAVNSLVGAINQFNNPMSNSILPSYITSVRYLGSKKLTNLRRNVHMNAYKNRNPYAGGKGQYILNIEELATIWHFPMSHVQTPNVQKAENKSAQPPIGLPVEMIPDIPVVDEKKKTEDGKPSSITDSGDVIKFDDFG